ncbi:MAG: Gfo/Idh/MocA family oxidoreductase [Marinoscillum sp.]
MKLIRVGIIGSGFAAQFHYEGLRRVHGVELEIVGVLARNEERLNLFAQQHDLKAYFSIEDLMDDSDVLHLCTPPATHESLTIQVLKQNKHVVVEKPFTGYFGDGSDLFRGNTCNKEIAYHQSISSIKRMLEAESISFGTIYYAENWIYAPSIQKEKELIEKTKAQILWIQGQQAHSGSHSPDYGKWRLSGGGSLMGKGAHPIAAALFLKQVEGRCRIGKPIRPESVTCRTHQITGLPNVDLAGNIRDSYKDVEDYASVHIKFQDGTIADIVASELLQGGVKNYIEIHANNHRTICNIAPNDAMQTYNPQESNYDDIYVVEKIGTKQGWSNISPDEAWFNGYQQEMQSIYDSIATGSINQTDSGLAADTISTIYAGYVSAERNGQEVFMDQLREATI